MSVVEKLDYGLFLLNVDDDATSVAKRVYADPHKASVLIVANPFPWTEVDRVIVPGKNGRLTTFEEGDSPQKLIERMFPGQPVSIYLEMFFKWNGGPDLRLFPGDHVFVPER